ncbi:unnamed protein product, partial [Pylaiella littoralis]
PRFSRTSKLPALQNTKQSKANMRASTALKLLPACCGFFLLTPASGAYTLVGCAEDDQGARVMEYGPIPEATMSAEICEGICYAQDPTY